MWNQQVLPILTAASDHWSTAKKQLFSLQFYLYINLLIMQVCVRVCLSTTFLAYYWTHQPNIFVHMYVCMSKELS